MDIFRSGFWKFNIISIAVDLSKFEFSGLPIQFGASLEVFSTISI